MHLSCSLIFEGWSRTDSVGQLKMYIIMYYNAEGRLAIMEGFMEEALTAALKDI